MGKKEIPKVKGQPGIQSAFPKVPKKENIPGPSGIGGSKNPSTNRGGGSKGNIFGFGGSKNENAASISTSANKGSKIPNTNPGGGPKGNIFGFGGLSFAPPDEKFGGLKTKGKSGAYVQNPGWKSEDNSSSGHVIKSSSTNSKNPGKTSDDSNVKDQLRKIWANKFDQKSENEPKRSEKSEGELVNCPICSAAMSASRINDHLDKECLKLDTRTEEKASKSSIKNPANKSIKSPAKKSIKSPAKSCSKNSAKNESILNCPSCQKAVHK